MVPRCVSMCVRLPPTDRYLITPFATQTYGSHRSSPKAFKLNPAAPKWRPASFGPTASMEVSVFQAPKPSYRPAAMGHHPHQVGHFCFLSLWSLSFVLLVLSAYRYHRSLPYNAFRHSNMGHTGHHPRRSS